MTRTPIMAANWKMNKSPSDASSFVHELLPLIHNNKCETVICAPFIDLTLLIQQTQNTEIKIGSQNCHFEENGAYTGEISAQMLCDIGACYVIIGHSERRSYFYETDQIINKKVKAALNKGLKVILCVGESLDQRSSQVTKGVLSLQTKLALTGISKEQVQNVVIAYEPVWAIGTGLAATAAQANESCGDIRAIIVEMYGSKTADAVCIQYGGSMNAQNAAELLAQPHIDGGLIGGASLKASDFSALLNTVAKNKF